MLELGKSIQYVGACNFIISISRIRIRILTTSIWTTSTIFGSFQLIHFRLNPRSEVRDPPIDPILSIRATAHSPTDISDENVLTSILVG